ncbi:unnamed protein product [Orchesella dallaii]|uniref:CUB domain-containing protein n=1 Tax=Orchesella dallaii TaxID=48710 RepID=A0ABP1QZ81_9HEXA
MKFFIVLIAALAVSASGQKIFSLDSLPVENLDQETRCGATIEADSGTLTVPSVGQNIEPGSICIYTIHLQTRSNFRFNISSLNVTGGERDEDCSDAAVRIYALTNLVPAESVESYTFCDDNPPPTSGSFFLSGNLATVIYHASANASEDSGFTLNFEAVAFQPIPTTHESSYTSATTGLIRYPVEGEYETNRVNTWLIKTSDADANLQLDVLLERIDMEECEANGNFTVNDVCLCDALIVYEISSTGILEERERLCSRSNDTLRIEYLGPNFIIAFFTDHIDVPGQGTGFQVIYKPHEVATTTTTSQPSSTSGSSTAAPTTTTPRPPATNYSSECGGVLTGTNGLIEYKLDGSYSNNERCLWTIRTPYRSGIRLQLNSVGFESRYDNLQIYTINSTGIQDSHYFDQPVTSPVSVVLNGTVAFVLFQSDYSNTGRGMSLEFSAEEGFESGILYYEDRNTVVDAENPVTTRFPESGLYRNLELSTLVYMSRYITLESVRMNITSLDLQVGTDGSCADKLHLYHVRDPTVSPPHNNHLSRYTPVEGICQMSDVVIPDPSNVGQGIILILATDEQSRANGIEVEVDTIGLSVKK